MRTFAIGDIHGCATALRTLLSSVPWNKGDTVVTLGDYVDRGPDTKGVIERLLQWREEVKLVTLRGNHEVMMLLARRHQPLLLDWCEVGGDATLASYVEPGSSNGAIPESHWDFLEKTKPFHESASHIFVHASAYPDVPMESQTEQMLYWERGWGAQRHQSGKTIICGHTPQRTGVPANMKHVICIDTCAYGGGWLTCLEPATSEYWQANEKGETRAGKLA